MRGLCKKTLPCHRAPTFAAGMGDFFIKTGDSLLLTDHAYAFVSKRDEFYKTNAAIFAQLKNVVIQGVYAVWDRISQSWLYEAPVLVKTPAGVLSVHVKSDEYIAVGWNDIPLHEKPQWLDEALTAGLDWTEDLEWRPYDKARPACGERIEQVLFHSCDLAEGWGVGIGLQCVSGSCLWLYDAGDVIAARVDAAERPHAAGCHPTKHRQ